MTVNQQSKERMGADRGVKSDREAHNSQRADIARAGSCPPLRWPHAAPAERHSCAIPGVNTDVSTRTTTNAGVTTCHTVVAT